MRRTRNDSPLTRFAMTIFAGQLLTGLTKEEQRDFKRIARKRRFGKGAVISRPDTVPVEVMILKEGEAELVSGSRLKTVRAVTAGEVLGLTESIARMPACVGLRARTDCGFTVVRAVDLEAYLRRSPDVCYRSAAIMAEYIKLAMDGYSKAGLKVM